MRKVSRHFDFMLISIHYRRTEPRKSVANRWGRAYEGSAQVYLRPPNRNRRNIAFSRPFALFIRRHLSRRLLFLLSDISRAWRARLDFTCQQMEENGEDIFFNLQRSQRFFTRDLFETFFHDYNNVYLWTNINVLTRRGLRFFGFLKRARNSKSVIVMSLIVQKQFAISEHDIVDDACFVTLLLIDRDSLDEIWSVESLMNL